MFITGARSAAEPRPADLRADKKLSGSSLKTHNATNDATKLISPLLLRLTLRHEVREINRVEDNLDQPTNHHRMLDVLQFG